MTDILNYLDKNPETGRKKLSKMFNITERKAREIVKKFKQDKINDNDELVDYTLKLELKNQKISDEQRIERKIRNEYRNDIFNKQLTDELIECFNRRQKPKTIKHENLNERSLIGIVQFTDAHFNEIIDLPENKYDFKIAAKRCKKFINETIFQFKNNNIQKVVFCMTGDLLNSDRRPDEKTQMVTSRARACYLATLIIEQMLLDLNKHFCVKVAFVVGNESRSFEIGKSEIILSDNYDLTIVNMLKLIFRDSDIEFIDSNLNECIISVRNKNILLTHGDMFSKKNLDKNINDTISRYTRKNIKIDYIIFGHLHETCISDFYGRSASLSGGNGYSSFDLNLSSRASQNIYIVDEWINGMKIDLQNTDEINGYCIDECVENKLNVTKNIMNSFITKI